jgi:ABC-2 type transport system ATP-binding protein
MNAVSIHNLNKTYKTEEQDVEALSNVTFDIKQGEMFGLLGPNGAGKTTLINILSGVTEKSSGKAGVAGHDVDENPVAVKHAIGVVPQEIAFDAFFTVEDALRFQFGYYDKPVDEGYLNELLDHLVLQDKRDVKPRQLSGGMKRRLMIARALIHKPDVLVLDEPTAGVDVELRHELYDMVRELHERGITIILTSHYLEEVELLCERVAILRKGELVALDKKQELKDRFETDRTLSLSLTEKVELPEVIERFNPSWHNGELRLTFAENAYKDVLKAVAEADLPVTHFNVREPSLEDVFLDLTKDQYE